MINASNEGICVLSFEEKTTQPWFTYFQICRRVLNLF